MFNELLKNVMNLGIITEDDVKRLTAIELMMLIIERTNGLLNHVEIIDEKLTNLLEEIRTTTIELLNKWKEDGTLEELINQTALKHVNDRIDETNTQLSDITLNLRYFGCKDITVDDTFDNSTYIQNAIDYAIENNLNLVDYKTYYVEKTILIDFMDKTGFDIKLRLKPKSGIKKVIECANGCDVNLDIYICDGGQNSDIGLRIKNIKESNVKIKGSHFGGILFNVDGSDANQDSNKRLNVEVISDYSYKAIVHGNETSPSSWFGCYTSIIDRNSLSNCIFRNSMDITIKHFENVFPVAGTSLSFNSCKSIHIDELLLGGLCTYMLEVNDSTLGISQLLMTNENAEGVNMTGVIVRSSKGGTFLNTSHVQISKCQLNKMYTGFDIDDNSYLNVEGIITNGIVNKVVKNGMNETVQYNDHDLWGNFKYSSHPFSE